MMQYTYRERTHADTGPQQGGSRSALKRRHKTNRVAEFYTVLVTVAQGSYSVPHYKTRFLIFGHLVDYLQNHAISTHMPSK